MSDAAIGQASPAQAPVRASTAATPTAPTYRTGAALWLTGLVLALANFMAVLDTTIANVSITHIAGGLAVSPSQATWTITSYSVAEAITVPLSGWLAQRFGAVRVFVAALIGFGVFSALCGLAPSLGFLVTARICQGLCGGPMIPLSQTLLLRVFPPKMAPTAISLWSMTTVVAPIVGPILGGTIVDIWSWPWVFYITVPVAFGCAFAASRMLKSEENAIVRRPIDLVGMGLLVLWVGSLQIMLDKGQELDWFQSPVITGLLVTAIVGFIAFLIWELTAEDPVVNLRLFRSRGFATASLVMTLTFGAFFSSVVLMPLWLQTNIGYTSTWAGYATAFTGVLAVVMSPVVGKLMQSGKADPRALICFGVLWLAATMVWRTTFNTDINFGHIILPLLAQGFAMPFFFIPLMGLGTGSLAPQDVASGAGLINFMRTTSGAFGISLATTSWGDSTTKNHVQLSGMIDQPDGVLSTLQQAGLSPDQALRQLDGLVQGQSVMLATNQTYMLIAILMVVAAISVWIAPKPSGPPRMGPAH